MVDTEEEICQCWAEVYAANGGPLPVEKGVKTVGANNQEFQPQHHLEERLGRPLTQEEIDRRIARRVELVLAKPLLPGVAELARAAKAQGMKVGVASSSSRDWVRGHLERLGILDLFDCLCSRADLEHLNPPPHPYLPALPSLGLNAFEAVALEDSP